MAIILNDNVFSESNKPQDAKYGPWGSTALALAGLPREYRHRGLTVGVLTELGGIREYWFKTSVFDEGLVRKFTTEDLASNDLLGDANLNIGGHHHYLSIAGQLLTIGGQQVSADLGRNNIPSALRRRNMRVSVHGLDNEPPTDYVLAGRFVDLPAESARLVQTRIYEQWFERWTYQNGDLTNSTKSLTYYMLRSGEALAPGSRYCELLFNAGSNQWQAPDPGLVAAFVEALSEIDRFELPISD